MSYPIGAVMTLQTGKPDVRFKPRLMEGVELAAPQEPEFLLLDGQQRTTPGTNAGLAEQQHAPAILR